VPGWRSTGLRLPRTRATSSVATVMLAMLVTPFGWLVVCRPMRSLRGAHGVLAAEHEGEAEVAIGDDRGLRLLEHDGQVIDAPDGGIGGVGPPSAARVALPGVARRCVVHMDALGCEDVEPDRRHERYYQLRAAAVTSAAGRVGVTNLPFTGVVWMQAPRIRRLLELLSALTLL
jgi:hypothetical protein